MNETPHIKKRLEIPISEYGLIYTSNSIAQNIQRVNKIIIYF